MYRSEKPRHIWHTLPGTGNMVEVEMGVGKTALWLADAVFSHFQAGALELTCPSCGRDPHRSPVSSSAALLK